MISAGSREVEPLSDARTKLAAFFNGRRARIIHEYLSEAFETEARRGFSQVRPTQAYLQSVEEAEREKPRRARGSDDGAGVQESSWLAGAAKLALHRCQHNGPIVCRLPDGRQSSGGSVLALCRLQSCEGLLGMLQFELGKLKTSTDAG